MLRLNEGEPEEGEAELLIKGVALLRSGHDTSVPQLRLPGKTSFVDALVLGAPPLAGYLVGPEPVLPLARVPAAGAAEEPGVWVCAEQR